MPVSKARQIIVLREKENKLIAQAAWTADPVKHDRLTTTLRNIREKIKSLSD